MPTAYLQLKHKCINIHVYVHVKNREHHLISKEDHALLSESNVSMSNSIHNSILSLQNDSNSWVCLLRAWFGYQPEIGSFVLCVSENPIDTMGLCVDLLLFKMVSLFQLHSSSRERKREKGRDWSFLPGWGIGLWNYEG